MAEEVVMKEWFCCIMSYIVCEQVGGGSPASEQVEGGLESADLRNDMAQDDHQKNSLNDTQGDSQETQYSENNLGDANDSDGDVNNSEGNGDVSRSNADNK